MQVISFPLFALFLVEVLMASCLTAPVAALRFFMSNRVKVVSGGAAAKPVFLTLAGVIASVFMASMASILRTGRVTDMEIKEHGHAHNVLQRQLETYESYLMALLSGTNLVLALLIKALASKIDETRRQDVNLALLKRQAEQNMTQLDKLDKIKMGASERTQGDAEVIAKLEDLRKKLEESERAKAAASKDVDAMKAQAASLGKEYDRLLAENDTLKAKLAKHDNSFAPKGTKKDE